MKYLKKFNENISIYNPEWEQFLPETLTILKGQVYGVDKITYNKGNIMLNADMIQICYDTNQWTIPDTLEIDIYTVRDSNRDQHLDKTTVISNGKISYNRNNSLPIPNLRIDIDITFGDQMACEFSIDKSGVKLIQYTSIGSQFDPSNTEFSFIDEDLQKFVNFLNRFNNGIKISIDDLYFLRHK